MINAELAIYIGFTSKKSLLLGSRIFAKKNNKKKNNRIKNIKENKNNKKFFKSIKISFKTCFNILYILIIKINL
jgi:hypothetical protein